MKRGLVVFVLVASVMAGCGRQRVVTQPEMPPLAPPPPPPRVVAPPSTTEEEAPAPKPSEPVRKPARPQPPRTDPTRDTTKPDAARRDSAAKGETPQTPPSRDESATPPPVLQTTPPATQGEMDKQARAAIAQASHDLGRVNRNGLNGDGRSQYDAARRFVEQAQQALKQQNFMLALTLANKAATIAAGLVGG